MALSEATVKVIKQAQQKMPMPRSALLFALRTVQADEGQVGPKEVEALSELFAISPVQIEGVARFYDLLSPEPEGRHPVRVCEGVVCVMRGGDAIWEFLGTQMEGIFSKHMVALSRVACLGHCDHAPAALVDDSLVGPLDHDDVRGTLEGIVGRKADHD